LIFLALALLNDHTLIHQRLIRSTAKEAIVPYALELWQADSNGMYDLSNPRPNDFPYEFWPNTANNPTCRVKYNAKSCSIVTTVPGKYFEKSINNFREPHLHIKIRAKGYQSLTTQLFFPREPEAGPSPDPWYKPENTLTYIKYENFDYATFVFYL
jgi:protocatechuate 3,4-dioxygenase beta subunit